MQTPHKISVLVAEDNPVNQEVIIAMLEDYGIETELVENGRDAVNALARGPFDLIFMDCQMPEMDGFQATSCIRNSNQNTRNIPIIAMTANVMMQDRSECFAAGMNDYLGKPIRRRELAGVLNKWLPVQAEEAPEVVAETVSAGGHLNQTIVDNMRNSMKDRFGMMYGVFLKSATQQIEDMGTACSVQDWKRVGTSAHSLKASGQVGAQELHRLASSIEQAAKSELSHEGIPDLIKQARQEFQLVKAEIEKLLPPA